MTAVEARNKKIKVFIIIAAVLLLAFSLALLIVSTVSYIKTCSLYDLCKNKPFKKGLRIFFFFLLILIDGFILFGPVDEMEKNSRLGTILGFEIVYFIFAITTSSVSKSDLIKESDISKFDNIVWDSIWPLLLVPVSLLLFFLFVVFVNLFIQININSEAEPVNTLNRPNFLPTPVINHESDEIIASGEDKPVVRKETHTNDIVIEYDVLSINEQHRHNRGYSYYRRGKVRSMSIKDNVVSGNVQGRSLYFVSFEIANKRISTHTCTCPDHQKGYICKHVFALAYEFKYSDKK